MSRGGRGGRGRGGFGRGRGAFGGGSSMPPMGLTFADLQSLSREEDALYPPLDPLPTLTDYSSDEKRICELQINFATRMRNSAYYVVETTKSTELSRYSDKYRPTATSQPILRRKGLNAAFFPPDLFENYFNPKKKRKIDAKGKTKSVKLDELAEDADEQEKSGDDHSDAGSQVVESDYDVDEEYDNDYADNYFDNGEADDMDDLGGGGDGGDGGGDYD